MKLSRATQVRLIRAAPPRNAWQTCIALFTALIFSLVVISSASHLHKSASAANECTICCAVVNSLADAPTLPLLVHANTLQSYRTIVFWLFEAASIVTQLFPSICGPPDPFCVVQ